MYHLEIMERNITLATGSYSRLECCFVLRRSATFYFLQQLLPTTAVVITSWMSLWLERECTFKDMIQIILSITFLYHGYNTLKVSYVKAMDLYLGTCFLFVILSLLKLAALKAIKECYGSYEEYLAETHKKMAKGYAQIPEYDETSDYELEDLCETLPIPDLIDISPMRKRRMRVRINGENSLMKKVMMAILRFSRTVTALLFPTLFLGFCVFYLYSVVWRLQDPPGELCTRFRD